MLDIIKNVLDKNGIMQDRDAIAEELQKELTEGGYIHIDRIRLDDEKIILCVSEIINKFKEDNPIIIEG